MLSKRTRHLALVFEDIEKTQNVSAVLRSAECFGIQDVHFIKNRKEYQVNLGIVKGSDKWLSLHHHNVSEGVSNVEMALSKLRNEGYRVLGTSLDPQAQLVEEVDLTEKTAIVFGCEQKGISDAVRERADGLVRIGMNGFTESFNLSVSAAIILSTFMRNQRQSWHLNEQEKVALKAEWYHKVVKEADKILARLN